MARLMDAGLDAFAESGWHEASIDDIAARAGAGHGTFYLYFGNKQDLLLTLAYECADVMVGLVGELDPPPTEPESVAALRAWLARFFAAYGRYRGVVRAWMESQVDHPELLQLGRDVMTAFGARFTTLTGDDPARAAALLALIERFSYVAATREMPVDADTTLDTLAVMIHRGFLSGTGRATTSS